MSDRKSMDSMFKLVHSLKRSMQEQIEGLELDVVPMQVRVLKIIANKPQCTAIDIANVLDRDKAQVTRLLNSLIKQELIAKAPNPEDKRSQCLLLTEGGQQVMSKVSGIDKVMFNKMSKGLSEEELDVFQRVISKITANLNER